MSETQKNRGGRPPVNATPVTVRVPPELLAALDSYSTHADGNPGRPETVRRIMRDWLMANGYLRPGHVEEDEGLRPDQLTTENDG